jgi:hypothetical protein
MAKRLAALAFLAAFFVAAAGDDLFPAHAATPAATAANPTTATSRSPEAPNQL